MSDGCAKPTGGEIAQAALLDMGRPDLAEFIKPGPFPTRRLAPGETMPRWGEWRVARFADEEADLSHDDKMLLGRAFAIGNQAMGNPVSACACFAGGICSNDPTTCDRRTAPLSVLREPNEGEATDD